MCQRWGNTWELYDTHGEICVIKNNTFTVYGKNTRLLDMRSQKRNVTDSGTSSTRTLVLLSFLLTAQTLNHKHRVKWSARRVSDHVTDRRTSPKINTGFPARCLHQILRGQIKFLTYMYLYHLPWLECIERRRFLLIMSTILHKNICPQHSLVTLKKGAVQKRHNN